MGDIKLEARRGRTSEGTRFFRFRPKQAIRELSAAEGQYLLSKEYSAIALIFWAFFNGRPGRRTDPEDKSLIYTSDARRAGNLFLLFELHRILPKKATAQNEYSEIMRLLEDTEGFANAIVGDSAEELLSRCRERGKDIRFVNEIVKYMVRER